MNIIVPVRTELDNRYFIRENYDILSDVHCHLLDRDTSFTTLHDSSVAEFWRIIA